MAISHYDLPLADLLAWGESIKPRAQMAWDGKGEFVAGDHCQFCRIKGKCKARADQMAVLYEQQAWRSANQMSPADIAELLPHLDGIIKWCNDVQDYALEQARDHAVRIPGFKLVEGRSNRAFTNREEMVTALLQAGFTREQIYKAPDLIGVTDMEKLLGKKTFAELLGDYITKPQGKAALVPVADKRPELASNVASDSDFDGVE